MFKRHGKSHEVPEMIPELVVPDLTDFKVNKTEKVMVRECMISMLSVDAVRVLPSARRCAKRIHSPRPF